MRRIMKLKKTQSILEYICVCTAFAAVGIGTFLAVVYSSFYNLRGPSQTYTSSNTVMDQTLNTRVDANTYKWPSAWSEGMKETSNFDDTIFQGQIADADGETVGTPLTDFAN